MLLALLAWVWVAGSALARDRPASERFAVGALAACGLAWTAMVAGALGVGLLGSTLATAGLALAAAAVFLALRPPLRAPRPAVAPLVTGCVAGLVLSAPQLALSLGALQPSRGDLLWHLGWIHQLEDGAAIPGGVYAGEPNGYPWLFHALVAWIAGALPGGAESAVWAMQGFGLACAGTGIWLLAMEICDRRRAATWSVGLFLAAASLGWAADAHGHRFDMATIDAGPFHGSPVPALTPATTFLPPMIPRDLGLALVPIVLWLALRAISGRVALWWAVGAAGGLVFLIAPPAGLLCAAWVAVFAVMERRRDAWRAAPAGAAVVAPWLVPLALAYLRYHGFVQTTELDAGTPSAGQSLAAVGLTLPLAAAGMAVLARERRPALSRSLALVAVPALAVVAGLLAAARRHRRHPGSARRLAALHAVPGARALRPRRRGRGRAGDGRGPAQAGGRTDGGRIAGLPGAGVDGARLRQHLARSGLAAAGLWLAADRCGHARGRGRSRARRRHAQPAAVRPQRCPVLLPAHGVGQRAIPQLAARPRSPIWPPGAGRSRRRWPAGRLRPAWTSCSPSPASSPPVPARWSPRARSATGGGT